LKKLNLVEFLEKKGGKGKEKKKSWRKIAKHFLIITFWSNLSLNVVRCFVWHRQKYNGNLTSKRKVTGKATFILILKLKLR